MRSLRYWMIQRSECMYVARGGICLVDPFCRSDHDRSTINGASLLTATVNVLDRNGIEGPNGVRCCVRSPPHLHNKPVRHNSLGYVLKVSLLIGVGVWSVAHLHILLSCALRHARRNGKWQYLAVISQNDRLRFWRRLRNVTDADRRQTIHYFSCWLLFSSCQVGIKSACWFLAPLITNHSLCVLMAVLSIRSHQWKSGCKDESSHLVGFTHIR